MQTSGVAECRSIQQRPRMRLRAPSPVTRSTPLAEYASRDSIQFFSDKCNVSDLTRTVNQEVIRNERTLGAHDGENEAVHVPTADIRHPQTC
jgi:hypothetical protein